MASALQDQAWVAVFVSGDLSATCDMVDFAPLSTNFTRLPGRHSLLIFKNLLFFFLTGLGLRCLARSFSGCGQQVAVPGASLVAERWLQARGLRQCSTGSRLSRLMNVRLVAPRHVDYSWTRDRTHVSYIGMWIPIQRTTREVPHLLWLLSASLADVSQSMAVDLRSPSYQSLNTAASWMPSLWSLLHWRSLPQYSQSVSWL